MLQKTKPLKRNEVKIANRFFKAIKNKEKILISSTNGLDPDAITSMQFLSKILKFMNKKPYIDTIETNNLGKESIIVLEHLDFKMSKLKNPELIVYVDSKAKLDDKIPYIAIDHHVFPTENNNQTALASSTIEFLIRIAMYKNNLSLDEGGFQKFRELYSIDDNEIFSYLMAILVDTVLLSVNYEDIQYAKILYKLMFLSLNRNHQKMLSNIIKERKKHLKEIIELWENNEHKGLKANLNNTFVVDLDETLKVIKGIKYYDFLDAFAFFNLSFGIPPTLFAVSKPNDKTFVRLRSYNKPLTHEKFDILRYSLNANGGGDYHRIVLRTSYAKAKALKSLIDNMLYFI